MDLDVDYPEDVEYYYDYSNEEEEYDDEDDDEPIWDGGSSQGNYCGFPSSFLTRHYLLPPRTYLTQEEADRNAQKLLEEEEREKERANKKRLKKKRQKDRKRQQRQQETPSGAPAPEERAATPPNSIEDSNRAPPGKEEPAQRDRPASASEDDLDLGSTFVRKAQKKMASKPKPERRERAKETSRERAQTQPKERAPERSQERQPPAKPLAAPQPDLQNNLIKVDILDRYKIQESMDLASMGNNLANRQRFADSLHFYTEAIKINPSEYRFLGNRSYSYERLGQYKEALADADKALELKPDFLKGFFRKGKALKGLKRYSEAIAAFKQVLICDVNHVEAAQEVTQCQKLQELMTSTRVKILSSAPLSPPATPPPAPGHNQKVFVSRNIYNSKPAAISNPPPPIRPISGAAHSKLFPIWVGNVTNKITEEILRSIFESFGPLHSIRVLYSRTCAFVNFTSKEAAESAYRVLQGLHVGGNALVLQLRNPDHIAGARRM